MASLSLCVVRRWALFRFEFFLLLLLVLLLLLLLLQFYMCVSLRIFTSFYPCHVQRNAENESVCGCVCVPVQCTKSEQQNYNTSGYKDIMACGSKMIFANRSKPTVSAFTIAQTKHSNNNRIAMLIRAHTFSRQRISLLLLLLAVVPLLCYCSSKTTEFDMLRATLCNVKPIWHRFDTLFYTHSFVNYSGWYERCVCDRCISNDFTTAIDFSLSTFFTFFFRSHLLCSPQRIKYRAVIQFDYSPPSLTVYRLVFNWFPFFKVVCTKSTHSVLFSALFVLWNRFNCVRMKFVIIEMENYE